MPARVSQLYTEQLAQGLGKIRVPQLFEEVLVTSYPAAPTPPVTGISATQVYQEVIVSGTNVKGVRVTEIYQEIIAAGESFSAGSFATARGYAFTFVQ